MSTLLHLVQDAAQYRRSGRDPALARRPVLVYCDADESAEALREFESGTGRAPAAVCWHRGRAAAPNGVALLEREALAERPDLLVWVWGAKERAKAVALAQHGVRDLVFAVDPPYKDTRYQPDLLVRHRAELERLFAMLHDDESRLTLASIIKQRLRGEHGFLRIAGYAEYAHPVVCARPGDTVVDGGAFDGQTSLDFARQAPGGRVLAFEPDPANRQRIAALLRKARFSLDRRRAAAAAQVEVAPHALYDRETTLRFAAGNSGSSSVAQSGGDGDIEVTAVSLDTYAEQQRLTRLDLVSLDVEGAEPQALAGMRGVIERFRPKLQVSLYHQRPHLWELPFQVESLAPRYRYFLGHHNSYSTETDLYAVPLERLGE